LFTHFITIFAENIEKEYNRKEYWYNDKEYNNKEYERKEYRYNEKEYDKKEYEWQLISHFKNGNVL